MIGVLCLLAGILYVRRQRAKYSYMVTPNLSDKKADNVAVEYQELDGRGVIQEVGGGDVNSKRPSQETYEMDGR